MEGCVLCLELNKAVCITGNSSLWQQLDIESIIEIHFWDMLLYAKLASLTKLLRMQQNNVNETLKLRTWNKVDTGYLRNETRYFRTGFGIKKQIVQPTSWLCNTCWQELYDFHKFYIRIEEAHVNFGKLVKKQKRPKLQNSIENLVEDKKDIADVLYESQLEPEISLNETLPTELIIEEQKLIKQEEQDEKLNKDKDDDEVDDDDDDDMPLIQTRKRKFRDKELLNEIEKSIEIKQEEDPLNKPRKSKRIKKKEPKANKSKRLLKKLNIPNGEPLKTLDVREETTEIKKDFELPDKPEECNNSVDSPIANDSDIESDFDFDKESLDNNETNRNSKNPAISDEKDKFIAENFKIICILCQIPMENFHLMRKHFKMEHKHIKKGYVICCNKKIFSRCVLFDHVNHHLDPNYFKCQQCDKVFKDRLCLTGHLKRHKGDMEKKFACDICEKSFSIPSLLKYHKMTHLPEEEKPCPCLECGKRFGNELSLTNHVRAVHLNKYAKICDVCGKSLSSADVFERHMLEHEGKPAPTISCDICGLLLTSKKGLKRHKNTIHPVGGHQEYTCSICSKVSPNRQAHDRHVKFSHEMGHNHKCTMCEKAFKKPRALKEHMATHTGDILYTCEWCPKSFNSSANFHSHRKKIHPVEWEEANRKKYAGNLPPSLKATTTKNVNDLPISLYMHLSKNCVEENQT